MDVSNPRAEVTVYSPLFTPFRQQLEGPTVSIGRASDCTIPVKDRYLSRRHAELVSNNGKWVLKDLGSANGTFLNGSRVEDRSPLKTGDRIRLGNTEIVFVSTEAGTDKLISVGNQSASPTISISATEFDAIDPNDARGVARLQTLNVLARELIEDRPMNQLFGFIVDRVRQHLDASRAALGLLGPDGKSFETVEIRRKDRLDKSELTISHTLLDAVVNEKKALAFLNVASDEKLSHANSIVIQGIHSIICAPVTVNKVVAGVLYVDYLVSQREISEEDVRLVAQIARFAANKLEQTRLREAAIEKRVMDEELKTASAIQRRLLPEAPKNIPGYTFAGFNRACRTVSGDYYDFVVRPDGTLYFVIADVAGKGVTAGLMMAGLQSAFRIFCRSDPDPSELTSQLNDVLKQSLPQSKFVTLFLGRLHFATGLVEYANAGHIPPLWLHSGGSVRELPETDLLLGVVTQAGWVNRLLRLEPGDALILFTDGVTDAENSRGDVLESELLAEKVKSLHGSSADEIGAEVERTVLEHVGGPEALADDVTLLVVSRDPAN